MLKRTKIGGEIHIAQASMLSTSACFLSVRPTGTCCKLAKLDITTPTPFSLIRELAIHHQVLHSLLLMV